jgi:hypothetical protein
LDYGESAIGKLIVGLLLAGAAAMAGAAAPATFEALRWTEPGVEKEILASQPTTCLEYWSEEESFVMAGRALFNTPALLGGQAAKAGLSCASCHVNGRDNPHFLLAGISADPGTADVTNSFFSAARSNGRFDPIPIPDLAALGKITRDPKDPSLERFIRNLIVEEFAGEEPSYYTLETLAFYVRAINACPPDGKTRISRSVLDQWIIMGDAVDVASKYATRGDSPKEVNLLIAAARHQLGLISERYAGRKFTRERKELLSASQQLQRIGQMPDAFVQSEALKLWQKQFDGRVLKRLVDKQPQSLYDFSRLAEIFPSQDAAQLTR